MCMKERERKKERTIGSLDFRHVKFEMLVQYPNGNVQRAVGSLEFWFVLGRGCLCDLSPVKP